MARCKKLIFVLLCATFGAPCISQSADINQNSDADISRSSYIVKFQHKLASKGNAQAQYRLACMFENGNGTEVDLEKAKYWYDLAAESGIKAAVQRRAYIEVKEKGFDPAADADWLASVKADTELNKSDATLLLAQLYHEGVGVKKDLNRSLELYNRVSILGEADVEEEIAAINKEIAANNRASRVKRLPVVKKEIVPPLTKPKKVTIVESAPVKAKVKKRKPVQVKPAKSAELSQIEKIKRYEKARAKLLKEQALIDELQNKMSGSSSDADDEI